MLPSNPALLWVPPTPIIAASYDVATTAWINAVVAAGGSVSTTQKAYIDTLIRGLKSDGLFSILDRLWIFAAENTQSAGIDLIALGTLISHGSPAFAANSGYTGDGSSAYFDSGFNTSTAGGNFTLNSANIGAYVMTSRTTNQNYTEAGSSDKVASATNIEPLTGGHVFASLNDGGANVVNNTNAQGLWIGSRTGSSAQTIYKNGSSVGTPNNASVSLNNMNIFILARNGNGTADQFSADQVAAVWWGAGLDATHAGNLSTLINNYMTSLGKNVY